MSARFDVAIIGGGLVGTSSALALRKHGLSVIVFDKWFCGAGASGVNYGGVRRQGRPAAQIPLTLRAHGLWPRLQQIIGIDGEFVASGHLKLARSETEMASLESYARQVAPLGLDLTLLSRADLAARFGWIADTIVGASLSPDDGQANPRLVASGFAAAARRAGAELCEQTPVLALEHDASGFLLDIGQGRTVKAACVINSAGAWGDEFASMMSEPVPLSRIYPSMVVTEPLPPLFTANIGMEGGSIYARQVDRGNCILGGERGLPLPDSDFSRPTAGGVTAIMRRASAVFPALRHAQAIRFWSGTEGAIPDNNPVVGASATFPGLVHAFGFCGAGFQLAPGVGEIVAELITTGRTETAIDAFSIQRFTGATPPLSQEQDFKGVRP